MKYRKKPVVIEAVQWTGDNMIEIFNLSVTSDREIRQMNDGSLLISTLEGPMKADKNDFIIRGVNGEVYPCKPDIFAKTYECA